MNRAVLHLQNIAYVALWSLVTYSNCLEWNLLKEQMIINFSTIYAVIKKYVCNLLLYHDTIIMIIYIANLQCLVYRY